MVLKNWALLAVAIDVVVAQRCCRCCRLLSSVGLLIVVVILVVAGLSLILKLFLLYFVYQTIAMVEKSSSSLTMIRKVDYITQSLS